MPRVVLLTTPPTSRWFHPGPFREANETEGDPYPGPCPPNCVEGRGGLLMLHFRLTKQPRERWLLANRIQPGVAHHRRKTEKPPATTRSSNQTRRCSSFRRASDARRKVLQDPKSGDRNRLMAATLCAESPSSIRRAAVTSSRTRVWTFCSKSRSVAMGFRSPSKLCHRQRNDVGNSIGLIVTTRVVSLEVPGVGNARPNLGLEAQRASVGRSRRVEQPAVPARGDEAASNSGISGLSPLDESCHRISRPSRSTSSCAYSCA
jgi:hypothetical protein